MERCVRLDVCGVDWVGLDVELGQSAIVSTEGC